MKLKWQKLLSSFCFIIALAIIPIYGYKVYKKSDYTDFDVYHKAAVRIQDFQLSQKASSIYSLQDGGSPFRYAPPTLLLFEPFSAQSSQNSKVAWFFLQILFFSIGFYLLHQILRKIDPQRASWVTALTFLFVLRFLLDCLTIGQVSSLLFLFFVLGLYSWCNGRSFGFALGLSVPTLFKLGPGFLLGLYFVSAKRLSPLFRTRFLTTVFGFFLLATTASGLRYCRDFKSFVSLWGGWFEIVLKDSRYFDSSHYGSQSFLSFLLRLKNAGFLDVSFISYTHLGATIFICASVLCFWICREPRSKTSKKLPKRSLDPDWSGRAYFYTLGIFPYLWFMPETFKYTLSILALPISLLLISTKTWLSLIALSFSAAVLSLPAKDLLDIVHPEFFFLIQKLSLPFLSTLILAAAVFQKSWKHSRISPICLFFLKQTKRALVFQPFDIKPGNPEMISFLLPYRTSSIFEQNLQKAELEIRSLFKPQGSSPESFEIILAPYGKNRIQDYSRKNKQRIQCCPIQKNFGGALRNAFLTSSGQKVIMVDICEPSLTRFYTNAIETLRKENRFVYHPSHGQTKTATGYFSTGFRAHLLSFFFGFEMPPHFFGCWAILRTTANELFAIQTSNSQWLTLEFILASKIRGNLLICWTTFQKSQNSFAPLGASTEGGGFPRNRNFRMFQALALLFIYVKYKKQYYHPIPIPRHITADDWGISPAVNRGILALAQWGVVRRVSIMANAPYLTNSLSDLLKLKHVKTGLHFDLTYNRNTPGNLISRWLWSHFFPGKPDTLQMAGEKEFSHQIKTLSDLGIRVQYFDGHHHIHLLPNLFSRLLFLASDSGIEEVRIPLDYNLLLTHKFPIFCFSLLAKAGLAVFNRKLRNGRKIQALPCFYPKSNDFSNFGVLRSKLRKKMEYEIITHPSSEDDFQTLGIPDSYSQGRVREFRTLRLLSSEPVCSGN